MRMRMMIGWGKSVDAVEDDADKAERTRWNVENGQGVTAGVVGAVVEGSHYTSPAVRVAELVQRPRQPERGETEPVPVLGPGH